MEALTDFYELYRPLQRRYDLRLFYKTNGKETKITIRQHGKELVKVTEETTEACFIRAKRELEERMKKYEDLEERGRLIKLPCKSGDKIFLDFAGFGKDIDEFTVKDFHLDCFEDGETILFCDYESNGKTLSGQIDVMEFGKTVFLTKTEAEEKLKELRGGENE